MKRLIKTFILLFPCLHMVGCVGVTPKETYSRDGALMNPGDLVVTSITNDSAVLMDEDGNYKSLLVDLPNDVDQVYGVAWNDVTKEVILAINGTPDRVLGVSAYDGSVREIVRNANLNGNIRGVAVTDDGDYLIIESNNIEKFTGEGIRVNDGTFPITGIMTNPAQISSLDGGGFVVCAYGTDRVRTYDEDGNQVDETSSGIGGTTNAYGCYQGSDGRIAAAWDGSTDSVSMYSSDLGTEDWQFDGSGIITAPRGLTVKDNGNVLVCDAGYDRIVEIDSSGEYVRALGSGLLADPWQIIEIPNY